MLSPLVRRTLAPRGQTPQLLVRGKHRQKVSIVAALTVSPRRSRLGLYFRTIANGSFDGISIAAFLRQLLRHVRGRIIVIWDRWNGHRGPSVRGVLAANPRLQVESLPAYVVISVEKGFFRRVGGDVSVPQSVTFRVSIVFTPWLVPVPVTAANPPDRTSSV